MSQKTQELYEVLTGQYGPILEPIEIWACINALGAKLSKDGNQWCFLWGDDIQNGVAGFGVTIPEAAVDFYNNVRSEKVVQPVPPRETNKMLVEDTSDTNLLDMLLEAINYAYMQLDGKYGSLSYVVSDKVKYIERVRAEKNEQKKREECDLKSSEAKSETDLKKEIHKEVMKLRTAPCYEEVLGICRALL